MRLASKPSPEMMSKIMKFLNLERGRADADKFVILSKVLVKSGMAGKFILVFFPGLELRHDIKEFTNDRDFVIQFSSFMEEQLPLLLDQLKQDEMYAHFTSEKRKYALKSAAYVLGCAILSGRASFFLSNNNNLVLSCRGAPANIEFQIIRFKRYEKLLSGSLSLFRDSEAFNSTSASS